MMNLKYVLIVDDESFIVDCVASILESRKDLNIYIYKAYNSLSALRIIEKTRIDLLITDIQMPAMDGFELTEKLQAIWANSKTIYLTAFSDFHYAQKAIQQGVIGYILKTAPDTEIINEVIKGLTIIDESSNQISLINDMQKNLQDYRARLNSQLFMNLIQGYYSLNHLDEVMEGLGFQISNDRFMLIICSYDTQQDHKNNQLQNLMRSFQIQSIVEHYIRSAVEHFYFEVQDVFLVGVLQLKSELDDSKQMLNDTIELAQNSCLQTMNSKTSFLLGPECHAVEIPRLWSLGKNLALNRNPGESYIYNYKYNNSDAQASDSGEVLFKPSFYRDMQHDLEKGDQERFDAKIQDVLDYISKHFSWHNNLTLQVYYMMLMVLLGYINKNNLGCDVAFYASLGQLFRPWTMESWEAVEQEIGKLTEYLFAWKKKKENESQNRVIENIRKYIEDHIAEDISLNDIAKEIGYSTSYLSKYYSESCDSTISEYIASRKMEKIRELMKNSSYSINDICSLLGFNSRTYFNNYIKRLSGMSPQQYRDSLRKDSASGTKKP